MKTKYGSEQAFDANSQFPKWYAPDTVETVQYSSINNKDSIQCTCAQMF